MSITSPAAVRVVLYEGSDSSTFADDERFEIFSTLLGRGYQVTRTTDNGSVTTADGSTLLVLGRFQGSPPSHGTDDASGASVTFCNLTDKHGAALIASIDAALATLEAPEPGGWKPWFPVIDYDRCTNCMQCLSFCLFDVYAVDNKDLITVQNQNKCKTDCPACSRVCPEVAILFPKYKNGPINGDVVRDSDLQREAMKVDVSALLGGDIYASLRDRQSTARKRFSTERDESKALLERKRCLKKLQSDLDIPDEVLMTLPSAGDIQERADRAKAKAEQRRARSQTVKDQKRAAPSAEEWGI